MKKVVIAIGCMVAAHVAIAAQPAARIQVLEDFKECNVSKLKAAKAPIALPGKLKIVRITQEPWGEHSTPAVRLTFSQTIPQIATKIKAATGYDFSRREVGNIGFDADETGEEDNYVLCYHKK